MHLNDKRRAQIDRLSEIVIDTPWLKFQIALNNAHYWIKASKWRHRIFKTIAFWGIVWLVEVIWLGIEHLGERPIWYKRIPFFNYVIDLFL